MPYDAPMGGETVKTVSEVSRLSGVSVRTLHHYDSIGLLVPKAHTGAGYRLYDEDDLLKLQSILLFRQLEFPLGEIRRILDDPHIDRDRVLADQIALLELKREHIDGLIAYAKQLREGENDMKFKAFDENKMTEYAARAKKRWGETKEYREFERQHGGEDPMNAADGMMEIFARFGRMKAGKPDSREAQSLVKELQDYITAHYYTCSDQILASLGQMYAAEGEFRTNIDAAGGAGTAEFAAKAIAAYCK